MAATRTCRPPDSRRGVDRADPRLRAGNRRRSPDARRLRGGRTDRACGSLSAGTRAAGGRAGQGSGHDADRDAAGGLRGMSFRNACPIHKTETAATPWISPTRPSPGRAAAGTRDPGVYEAVRRCSGIELTNSGLKNRLGLKRLRVRGRGSVFRVVWHKVAGWNVLRAAAAQEMCAWVSSQVAQTLKGGESGPNERLCALVLRRWDDFQTVFWGLSRPSA